MGVTEENENEYKQSVNTEQDTEERNKTLNSENEKEEEDMFSNVIDNCKMEIENIQISMVGSLESEEKENKETDDNSSHCDQEVSTSKDNGTTNSCLIDENEKSENYAENAVQKDSSITQEEENEC